MPRLGSLLKSILSLKKEKKKNPMSFECAVDGPNLSIKFKPSLNLATDESAAS
jgi:hypothetical protein